MKKEIILKLQNKSCYNCRWHKEFIPWQDLGQERLIEYEKKTYTQAIQAAIEEKKKMVVYKCCLDYGQRSDFPELEICINYK